MLSSIYKFKGDILKKLYCFGMIYILLILLSGLSAIEVTVKNNLPIKGDLLFVRNRKYYIAKNDTLYIIKDSVIELIDKTTSHEMDIIFEGDQRYDFDESKFSEVIHIPKPRNSKIKLKINLGLETLGKLKSEYEIIEQDTTMTHDVKPGYSGTICGYYEVTNKLDVGIGTTYQLFRKVKKVDESEFYFLPIFAFGSYQIYSHEIFYFLLSAKCGYNFFVTEDSKLFEDNDGGLFLGSGLEMIFSDRYNLSIMYQINYRKYKINDPHQIFKNQYRCLAVTFGIIIF